MECSKRILFSNTLINHCFIISENSISGVMFFLPALMDFKNVMNLNSINFFIGFWYSEGYIRTSSKEFSLKNLGNKMVHLTNDAV